MEDKNRIENDATVKWYREEMKKPLEEVRSDIFFREDNFQHEIWYEQFLMYTRIGVCQPDPEHVEEVQKALKIMGYQTRVLMRDGKPHLVPGESRKRDTDRAAREER